MTRPTGCGATARRDGTYTFTLPKGALYGLRLDPGIYSGCTFPVNSVTINEPRGFFYWFAPTPVLGAGAGRRTAVDGGCGRNIVRGLWLRGLAALRKARGRASIKSPAASSRPAAR